MSYFSTISRGDTPAGPVWLPFLETLAAQMEGCSVAALLADPTRWANALPRAAKLVDAQVIAVGFIDGLGLDAFATHGAEPWRDPGMNALVECVRRLAETVRPARELAVALPGPAALCHHLGLAVDRVSLDGIKPGLVKLLEVMSECRPDLVVLNETAATAGAYAGTDYRRICNTLKNVTAYFGVPLAIRVTDYADDLGAIQSLRNLRLDHLLLGRPQGNGQCVAELIATAVASGWHSLGLPLPGNGEKPSLPQRGAACYWCSAVQEADLELARKTGLAFAA